MFFRKIAHKSKGSRAVLEVVHFLTHPRLILGRPYKVSSEVQVFSWPACEMLLLAILPKIFINVSLAKITGHGIKSQNSNLKSQN
jgi:hypothetical protein